MMARQMEVFAGFTAQVDHEVGRLIDYVRSLPNGDNTLIFYILGDNGASAEGGLTGTINEMTFYNAVPADDAYGEAHLAEWGDPTTSPHFAVGWAWAMNTPFQWTKQIASHFGGTRNPMIVSWPERIATTGEAALPVPPRHRRGADDPGGGRHRPADDRQRHRPEADRRHQHALHLRRCRGARPAHPAVLRDDGQPRHLRPRVDRRSRARCCPGRPAIRPRRRRSTPSPPRGSCTTSTRTSRRPTTWPRRSRRSWPSCRTCSGGCTPSTTSSPCSGRRRRGWPASGRMRGRPTTTATR